MDRERWGSRIGMVLAIAGGAVGLGNFLRFPVQMAGNGGGAFMIPYFIAFLVLGIPLLWLELAMGRFGGTKGHGTTPGMFDKIVHRPYAKYFGVFGILLPLIVVIYYTYIESWTLAYSYFSLTGAYKNVDNQSMGRFLSAYQGVVKNEYFSGIGTAYLFFILTFAANIYVLMGGVRRGIELLARFGMPLLFVLAIIMMIKVLSLGTPDPAKPDWNVMNGLAFIWTPKLTELSSPSVWLAAAGQIFFTLSVGFGAIQTYSSYLMHDDDIALSGLATASTNEFVEVVLGST
ncbi:MAG: sodium:calcium symporter, partial [Oligoflexia bacterium]|nr:sodium:calcium symporter [Oligoflexia bacterium]